MNPDFISKRITELRMKKGITELCAAARQLSDEELSLLILLAKRMIKNGA